VGATGPACRPRALRPRPESARTGSVKPNPWHPETQSSQGEEPINPGANDPPLRENSLIINMVRSYRFKNVTPRYGLEIGLSRAAPQFLRDRSS
jgi:hypothetical protein